MKKPVGILIGIALRSFREHWHLYNLTLSISMSSIPEVHVFNTCFGLLQVLIFVLVFVASLPFCAHRWCASDQNEVQSLCDLWLEQERKRHFSALCHIHRKIMSPLSEDLRHKDKFPSLPIWKDDEVQVVWGHYKGRQTGKVVQVYKNNYVIYTEQANDISVPLAFTPGRWLSLD